MKKVFYVFCTLVVCLMLTGCTEKNIEGDLTDIMERLYEGISEDDLPMALHNTELDKDNFEYYAFTDAKYKEAIASESMNGSIAHSVVLIRLEDASDAAEVAKDIEKNAQPNKWLCVTAENTYVLSKGDLVVLIMSNELAPKIKKNFENLK